MSEYNHQLGSHENLPPNGQMLTLADVLERGEAINSYSLRPGDVIIGIDSPADFDTFESAMIRAAGGISNFHETYEMRHDIADPIAKQRLSQALRPARFNGRLAEGTAVVLPTDDRDPYVAPPLRLLVRAGLVSTGRGTVGQTLNEVIYREARTHRESGVIRKVGPSLNPSRTELLVDILNNESAVTAHAVAAIALRKTFQAGLPTLGKR